MLLKALRDLKLSSTQNTNLVLDPKTTFQMFIENVRDLIKSRKGCLLILTAHTHIFFRLKSYYKIQYTQNVFATRLNTFNFKSTFITHA